MNAPIACRWDGESLIPLGRFARQADQTFVIGQTYNMVEHEERSSATHRHFFAAINEAWQSLPEHVSDRFPNPESLRKYALIRTGYCDTQSLVASSRAEAVRLAAFIRPSDEFAVVTVEGATVTRYTARSQSMRAMGKADFAASKDKVLDFIAGLIGVEPAALANQAEAA